MLLRRVLLFALLPLLLAAQEAEKVAFDAKKALIIGKTVKEQPFYSAGEQMVFELRFVYDGAMPDGDYFIKWKRTGDDAAVAEGKEQLGEKPLVITTSLDRPGFVYIIADIEDSNGKTIPPGKGRIHFFEGGAGCDVDKIATVEEPADFDAFWNEQKKLLEDTPLEPVLTEVECDDKNFKCHAVTIPCPAGVRAMTGYLVIPADAKEKSLPATAIFHGYGTSTKGHRPPKSFEKGLITLNVNAHGYEMGRDDAHYAEFVESLKSNGRSYAFDPEQNKNPKTAYFYGMAMRLMRAFQYLKTRPEWNGKELIARGGSQGGLQAAWAAGLVSGLTKAYSDIPWCCNLEGGEAFKRNLGTWRIRYQPGLGYFDPVYHAKRVPRSCYVHIPRAGLGDYVCPPSGIAVYYNSLTCPKRINWYQGANHSYVPQKPYVDVTTFRVN